MPDPSAGRPLRPSVHNPLTKSYAIDQIEDVEQLRSVAHVMWEAFYACHSQASHVYSGECPECNAYVDGEAESGCERYHAWQQLITRGFGGV